MIAKLRRRHKAIWIILIVVIAPLFVISILSRNTIEITNPLLEEEVSHNGEVIKSLDDSQIAVQIVQEENGEFFLFLDIKEPVKAPLPSLYLDITGKEKIEESVFVANVGGRGTYKFPIKNKDAVGVLFYSSITNNNIATLKFDN